ncbi:LamG-like jellyroll fold domain-containing protein [Amycolatopsis sp. NPDC051128]|uniref:LamG-like jellyroll fold domain-containing protein n=1 Tax=Amycolatopsis sp. NPDC051128 TaxID=3155412 RepID=UPI0034358203
MPSSEPVWPSTDCHGITLADPIGVTVEGTTVVFAREAGASVSTLYYNVREAGTESAAPREWTGWYPLALDAQTRRGPHLRLAGMDLVTVDSVATTPQPADAAFRVVADGRNICCFRLSTGGTLYLDRFVLVQNPQRRPSDPKEEENPARWTLQRVGEVRYRRSGRRDIPAGSEDSLGVTSIAGEPFLEPTIELSLLLGGDIEHFDVALGPTSDIDLQRWHFVAATSGGAVHYLSCRQGEFDPLDVRASSLHRFTLPLAASIAGTRVPLAPVHGPAVAVYAEQERAEAGESATTVRRGLRLAVAVPVVRSGSAAPAGLAVLDFTMFADGSVAPPFESLECTVIDDDDGTGYPVPDAAVHASAAGTVTAVLLGKPRPQTAPALLDSADGLLHCYFAQPFAGTGSAGFAVAQFDPTTVRAQFALPWSADDVTGRFPFLAQRSGSSFNAATVTVADCAAGAAPDLCAVSIDYGPGSGLPRERWEGVPRALPDLVRILGGGYSETPSDAEVRSGQRAFYDADGRFPAVRLPMTLALDGGPEPAGPAHLELVTHRANTPLASVDVAAAPGEPTTLTIRYTLPGGATAQQTWAGLPPDTWHLVAVLGGDAAATRYSYQPTAADDTPIYALDGGILVFDRGPRGLELKVTAASDQDPRRCDLSLTVADVVVQASRNVSRSPATVAAALEPWFLGVSVDPLATEVPDQAVSSPLDLRAGSLLFDVLRPPADGRLVPGTVTAATWQRRTVGPLPPKTTLGRGMLALTAVVPAAVPAGREARAENGESAVVVTGTNGTWRCAHRPEALTLDGSSAVDVPDPAPAVVPRRNWTIESWLRPATATPGTVLAYDGGPAPDFASATPSYYLGTAGLPTLGFRPVRKSHGSTAGSYASVPANAVFDLTRAAFTWEAWIRPGKQPCGSPAEHGSLFQVYDTKDGRSVPLAQLALDHDRHLCFGYRTDEKNHGNTEKYVVGGEALPEDTWTHVAVTAQRDTGTSWTLQLFVDANVVVGAPVVLRKASENIPPGGLIGARTRPDVSMFGSITELRTWSTARSPQELRQSMGTALTGTEPGLTGYWPLGDGSAVNGAVLANHATATGVALNARLTANPAQEVVFSDQDPFIGIVTEVGGSPAVHARAYLEMDAWNHVAVVYEGTGALDLNPGVGEVAAPDYGWCESPAGFDFEGEFTVEAWVFPDFRSGQDQTILARWGPEPADQSFRFGIDGAENAFCTVNLVDSVTNRRVTLDARHSAPSAPCHLTAVLKSALVQDKKDECLRATLTMYVDGVPVESTTESFPARTRLTSVSSRSPLTLGVTTPPSPGTALEAQEPFRGGLTGVRFWSVGLAKDDVVAAMSRLGSADDAKGVVSAWWFGEGEGTVATDSSETNDLNLTSTDVWGVFAKLGRYRCYHNGRPIAAVFPAPASDAVPSYGRQLTVGAVQDRPGDRCVSGFAGAIAELRLWRSARSRAQIGDGLYRTVAANNPDMVAYWSFDGTAEDRTGRGSDGRLIASAAYSPSTAPVADEGPQVRNVYDGPVTAFQRSLHGRPSVLEYPETARRWDGEAIGVMRRGAFFTAPDLVLATGFGVGELELVYLGQVRTHPTLIGFVEGAPPVPSENLSRPLYNSPLGYNSYQDASTVTVRSTATSSFTFSSTDYRTKLRLSVDAKAGGSGGLDMATGFKIPIIDVKLKNALVKAKLGVHHKSDLELAQQTARVDTSAWTRTLTDVMGLRGKWEPPSTPDTPYLNPDVGRRYQPLNVGYALVESLTADLFALRLDSTGAMVGKVVLPDLDVPPDRAVITFRMRSNYVKNGTLDGRVGLVDDPDFPAADLTHGSYFRPAEAYRLADRVKRSEQLLRAKYLHYDAEARGMRGPVGPDTGDVTTGQFYDFEAGLPARGIVNRYVWTANGGLHAEIEQFSAGHERTYSGFYDYTHGTGLEASFEGQFGPSWRAGVFASLDALFGGHVKIQVGKDDTETRGMSLDITCPGDPMLQAYDDRTATYTTDPCPGKVEAYRFMAFYLPPSAENGAAFGDVVDRDWLRASSDPDAVALRNLKFTEAGAWRVLYRVTYVSRVPPRFDTNPNQTTAPAPQQSIMLADNPLLIDLVERAMSPGRHDAAAIGDAVVAVLTPPTATNPFALGKRVPWWQDFVEKARRAQPGTPEAQLLARIIDDAMTYFQAGYATGVLPLPTQHYTR